MDLCLVIKQRLEDLGLHSNAGSKRLGLCRFMWLARRTDSGAWMKYHPRSVCHQHRAWAQALCSRSKGRSGTNLQENVPVEQLLSVGN